MFRYVKTFLIAILKTVLKFVIRRLAWLILLALVTNFFEDIRKKLLEYITNFQQKIDESCQLTKKVFQKVVNSIIKKLDQIITKSYKLLNYLKKSTAFVSIKNELLEEKATQINAILKIPEIKKIIESKNILIPDFSEFNEIKSEPPHLKR